MMKPLLAVVLVVLSSMVCEPALAQARPLRVGISSPEASNPFHIALSRSIVETLKARQIDAVLLSANADVNTQINNLDDLVAAKVDAVLVAPLNEEAPAQAVQRVNKAGIPVFMYARTLSSKHAGLWLSFVGMDGVAAGFDKGRWLVDHARPGKVALLTGPAGAAPMIEQEQGFRRAIEPAGFKVVYSQPSVQTRESGIKLAEDALVAHRDLVAIYASNDDLALGAAQAVKAAGLKGKVAVLGLNGSPSALAALHNGDLAATVYLNPQAWGQVAANTVADFLQKRQVPPRFVPMSHRVVGQAEAFELIPPVLREKLGVQR